MLGVQVQVCHEPQRLRHKRETSFAVLGDGEEVCVHRTSCIVKPHDGQRGNTIGLEVGSPFTMFSAALAASNPCCDDGQLGVVRI